MANEIHSILTIPETRIDIIPNGINTALYKTPINLEELRSGFAQPYEKLVLFVGRLVQEKGVSTIVEAAPLLQGLNIKIIIVGEGYLKEELIRRVNELGLSDKVFVTGFLDGETIRGLFRVADVCLIPSIYEPFGIVALEAMAGGSPIVTSGSGGLGEILDHDRTAIFVYTNPESLAWGIRKMLTDQKYADNLRKEASKRVKSYEWGAIATSTIGTYMRTMLEYNEGKWKPF
jgi:glycosyltransferase involved in cell wall biosynthesis